MPACSSPSVATLHLSALFKHGVRKQCMSKKLTFYESAKLLTEQGTHLSLIKSYQLTDFSSSTNEPEGKYYTVPSSPSVATLHLSALFSTEYENNACQDGAFAFRSQVDFVCGKLLKLSSLLFELCKVSCM